MQIRKNVYELVTKKNYYRSRMFDSRLSSSQRKYARNRFKALKSEMYREYEQSKTPLTFEAFQDYCDITIQEQNGERKKPKSHFNKKTNTLYTRYK